MTTIMPNSELVRKAVEYIFQSDKQNSSVEEQVEQAGMRFNLSPRECEMLEHFLKKNIVGDTPQE
ncbi:hypothetical protein Dde_1947 [Oleidesulfovibrio alaskensis G20]|uniref:Nif11 domain-containing protein n=1 Tax=Oleidesulfovibrio alaskensis (strain ATCC BAA-1058 / DSM 17464 / G20) TaxID=207559 RepID=Q310A2_OLEA2|nr:hypothetical protein [Oleidesulfovibrio alaskensis]ABB38744.1 hypothetical protein Dde_1947 [Oleidesulfovibrio alaskensis G20]MBG0773057.1 hypothetical protein [Oleidesulfovibrio alaskensis]